MDIVCVCWRCGVGAVGPSPRSILASLPHKLRGGGDKLRSRAVRRPICCPSGRALRRSSSCPLHGRPPPLHEERGGRGPGGGGPYGTSCGPRLRGGLVPASAG